jgi:uncharacterized protein
MGKNNNNNNKTSQFLDQKYINVETYKKNGQAVKTPVWFALDSGGVIYIRTDMNSGKVKRASNNPHVRVAPCNARGQPNGEWINAEMKRASTFQSERANELLNHKYGLQGKIVRVFNKLRKTKPIVVCIQL